MPLIQAPGPTTIATFTQNSSATTGTTSSAGSWYEISPRLDRPGIQVTQLVSSAGATLNSTIYIEVSNDGVYPVATKVQTFALAGTTQQIDGATFATSMTGSWRYIRANANSISTSTGNAGSGSITVSVNYSVKY